MWHDLTLSAQYVVIFLIWSVCSCEEPLGMIHTPNILESWEGGSSWIGILPYWESIVRLVEWSYSRHLPDVSHRHSSSYHLVFEALNCPPVALADPDNRLRLSQASFTVSFVVVRGEGENCIIVELSTKQYPTRLNDSFEMQNLKSASNPDYLRLFSSGVLTMTQIVGAAPFPCPNPWGGGGGGGVMGMAHIFPPELVGESPNAVLTD